MNTERGTMRDDDDDEGAGYGKLIPEWNVAADDQVILAGLAVIAFLALGLGWNFLFGDDDGDIPIIPTTIEVAAGDADVAAPVVPVPEVTTTTAAATTTTTEAPTTTVAVAQIGEVQPAVDPFPGAITGTNDGATAILTGFVANQGESDEAEAAAAAVEGIESVDNQLVLLEPAVLGELSSAGVLSASATGIGTDITVSGTIPSEDDRQPILDQAATVEGVTNVIDDRLVVSVTAELNELPQVQFATASADILPASFSDLDAAAELIKSAGDDVSLEIQGYTDVRGDEAYNQSLSDDRTNSVRTYLVDAGVNPDVLTAKGYGATEQFGEGDSDEALAANRLVRFEELG